MDNQKGLRFSSNQGIGFSCSDRNEMDLVYSFTCIDEKETIVTDTMCNQDGLKLASLLEKQNKLVRIISSISMHI